jgi:uncharacterized protein YlxW (UPF0749 family)
MGASLLDQVLAETLDPAYARAAGARTARAAAGEPPRPAWRHRLGPAAVALTMAAAGLLAAVTYDQAASGEQGREEVRSALVAEIQAQSDTTDDLAAELEVLRGQAADAREGALAATAEGQRAIEDLDAAEQAAGLLAVTGPGLLVTLANAEPDADSDPVGGAAEEDARGRVQDGDLQLVVNALWASGAEAVAINGQRLGPTTAIRFAGEAVLVDFRPVANPYEISAVGDPAELRSRFLASPEVGALAAISESFGLRFEFAEEDELSVPAGGVPELRSAVPFAGQPAEAAATGTGG